MKVMTALAVNREIQNARLSGKTHGDGQRSSGNETRKHPDVWYVQPVYRAKAARE